MGLWPITRSPEERLLYLGKAENKGYVAEPLIQIDLKQCPVDYLHLCKGVIGKQVNQVW